MLVLGLGFGMGRDRAGLCVGTGSLSSEESVRNRPELPVLGVWAGKWPEFDVGGATGIPG